MLNQDEKAIKQLNQIENSKFKSRVEHYKKQIINLSTTTKLLSPLTAFVGVRQDGTKVSCRDVLKTDYESRRNDRQRTIP